jgi:hypothetical protein
MRSIPIVIALALPAAACSSPFDPQEVRALAESRRQWEQRGFADYSFEARHDCFFCLPEEVGPVRITVRQGAIVEVTLLETGAPVEPGLWFTIDDLYQQVPSWAKIDGVDDVAVDYDPTLGFPSRIEVRYEEGIMDAGDNYVVTNVGPA